MQNNNILIITEKPSVARAIASYFCQQLQTTARKNNGFIQVGNNITITHAVGHLLELCKPEVYNPKYKTWKLENYPFIPDTWLYEVKKETADQYKIIKGFLQSNNFNKIIHAGDPDREGQILIDEIFTHLKQDPFAPHIERVLLTDLTERGINKAMQQLIPNAKMRQVSMSGFARSHADWLLGMNLSPVTSLYAKEYNFKGYFKIGRVVIPTLNLVYQREMEISNFQAKDFYHVYAQCFSLDPSNPLQVIFDGKPSDDNYCVLKLDMFASYKAQHPEISKPTLEHMINDERFGKVTDEEGRLTMKAFANQLPEKVAENPYATVIEATTSESEQIQPLGFSLNEIQSLMFNLYKIGIEDTLKAIQNLYQAGYVTYPRTDNNYFNETDYNDRYNVINHLLQNSHNLQIDRTIIDPLLNANQKTRVWQSKKVENHSAIAPTTRVYPFNGTEIEKKAYNLIAKRYLMQFLPRAVYKKTNLAAQVEAYNRPWILSAKSSSLVFHGWKLLQLSLSSQQAVYQRQNSKVVNPEENEESSSEQLTLAKMVSSQYVANVITGDILKVNAMHVDTSQTTPPQSLNEASLLTAMTNINRYVTDPKMKKILRDSDGIGTEATRAAIINKLFTSQYCTTNEKKQIKLLPIGKALIESLPPELSQPDTTARWEKYLNDMADTDSTNSYQEFMCHTFNWIRNLVYQIANTKDRFQVFNGMSNSEGFSTGSRYKAAGSYSKGSYKNNSTYNANSHSDAGSNSIHTYRKSNNSYKQSYSAKGSKGNYKKGSTSYVKKKFDAHFNDNFKIV